MINIICIFVKKVTNMINKVKKTITLTNGEIRHIKYDTMECPMCTNGHVDVKEILGDEWLVMECPECGARLLIPFVSITEEPLDE